MDQRILPLDAVGQDHADMGAGHRAGKRAAVGAREGVEIGIARRHADGGEHGFDRLIIRER